MASCGPAAVDAEGQISLFVLIGQSSMAGRGRLPEFQILNPDILGFHYLHDEWGVASREKQIGGSGGSLEPPGPLS